MSAGCGMRAGGVDRMQSPRLFCPGRIWTIFSDSGFKLL